MGKGMGMRSLLPAGTRPHCFKLLHRSLGCRWSLMLSGWLAQKLSRKLVHITTGLLFMLSWPLFRLRLWHQLRFPSPSCCSVRAISLTLGVNNLDRSLELTFHSPGLYFCITSIFNPIMHTHVHRHEPIHARTPYHTIEKSVPGSLLLHFSLRSVPYNPPPT